MGRAEARPALTRKLDSILLVAALVLTAAAIPAAAHAERPRFGVRMDVGVPSGASGSLVYRPLRAVRLRVGGAHNIVSPGLQAGVTVVPLDSWISPTFVLEAGRFFTRDANPAVEQVSGQPSPMATPERFGYDFASAHVGVEVGREWLTCYVHGGVSAVHAQMSSEDTTDDGTVTTMSDAQVRAVGVSASLGFIVYFAR